jgi:hypothetical protein
MNLQELARNQAIILLQNIDSNGFYEGDVTFIGEFLYSFKS